MTEQRALVRRPGPRLADGIVTHIERTSVDVHLAQRQWGGYVEALQDAGWQILEVPPADECPDSVFIEDTMVVFRDRAVIARSGAEQRRPETTEAERVVAGAGLRLERIIEPATLDGGDVLKVGHTVYVGLGGRTNGEGVAQLRRHLEPLGAKVVDVPVTNVLHLKSAVTALPNGTVIGCAPLLDNADAFDSFLEVPEETGSHVVLLGGNAVLMAASAPRTAELLAHRGLDVVTVDISEFERLEGGVTCLSVRLRG